MATLLQRVAVAMERIAPLRLADTTWDNVGVLVENPSPNRSGVVLLTVDLTDAVLQECIEKNVEVVVAYHPPIFSGWKKLTLQNPKQAIVLRAVVAGMSVFTPHTSLDAAPGGMNDWLCQALDENPVSISAIQPSPNAPPNDATVVGMGRQFRFSTPPTVDELVQRVKKNLSLRAVRVSVPFGWDASRVVETAAVCAGSGSGVFRQLKQRADVLLTGEMGHHDVLAAAENGQVVILCEHTNTERGFLVDVLRNRLRAEIEGGGNTTVIVSERDADPLVVC